MTTIEAAREALEVAAQHYGSQCAARSLDADAYRALMEAADAYALAAHVDGCAFEEFDSSGEWRECGQEGWLCDTGKRIEELGK